MAISPRVSEVLKDFVDAVDDYAVSAQEATGDPLMLGTEASAEVGTEGRLAWRSQTEPVLGAHSTIRMGHFFVLDAYRSLARLTIAERPTVYGPFVLARSLLDAAAWVYWLSEPGIGADNRVQRNLALRIAELHEQVVPNRPELRSTRGQARRERRELEQFCRHHGWGIQNANRNQPLRVGSQSLPGRRSLIDRLFRNEEQVEISAGLGATLWWFLSGFAHAGMDGLMHVVERNPSTDPTEGSGLIYVRADSFVWLLVATGRATIATTRRRMALFGEPDKSLVEKQATLERQFNRYLAGNHQLPRG